MKVMFAQLAVGVATNVVFQAISDSFFSGAIAGIVSMLIIQVIGAVYNRAGKST